MTGTVDQSYCKGRHLLVINLILFYYSHQYSDVKSDLKFGNAKLGPHLISLKNMSSEADKTGL